MSNRPIPIVKGKAAVVEEPKDGAVTLQLPLVQTASA